ncbi:Uncharacterised protein [Mycobacteroides abscessus subsp. abscessus]|nr:hypothetical protein S7W_07507 [Mycobacteroides abscessus M94]SIN59377.1 Uncharacterised protein [Mycobacteroides abscessus subsp. abscessus]SLD43392.1 Uncharacterised protein [Mycobacteroides abscessus subsp. massiliense]SKF50583.1 Uncharacterised protein [Mycobacteroides abscessus subsp. abscessus]SKK98239.1 Uncharacterised protein [Mycobacteroides abscessus subsp. abscessus]
MPETRIRRCDTGKVIDVGHVAHHVVNGARVGDIGVRSFHMWAQFAGQHGGFVRIHQDGDALTGLHQGSHQG